MSLVRVTIQGDFWDSQIYRGALYLFERAGSILTLDWDRLVDDIAGDPALRLAATCASSLKIDFAPGAQKSRQY